MKKDTTMASFATGGTMNMFDILKQYTKMQYSFRSSVALRFDHLIHAGGVNSIDRFAASWQRAAGFFEVTPVRPSFRFAEDGEEEGTAYSRQDIQQSPDAARSLLRDAFHDGRRSSDNAVEDGAAAASGEGSMAHRLSMQRRRMSRDDSIFSIQPSLDSPFGGSYGTQYGSLGSRLNRSSIRHAAQLFDEQQAKGVSIPDKERAPLLVKTVEEDGVAFNVVVGQSTLPQTVFNSVNVLIGVGLLSMPLALHYSGLVVGAIFYIFAVFTTQYTAKLLAKCLDVDSSLITFADLAYVSFGHSARIVVSLLFTLELIAANVALIVLFADSLDDLIPGWGIIGWKILAAVILIPLVFLPLRLLSFTSVLGIISCFGSKSLILLQY
jgi:vesicular inhibitory amino acid transporter